MRVLDVHGLNVSRRTEQGTSEIVRNMNLYVDQGEIVGLAGESGSGKSTAMLAVMGLPGRNVQIRHHGITVCGEQPAAGKNTAMIFQDSLACLNPSVKVGRQITETVRARRKCSRKEARIRAHELLEQVGIRHPEMRMRQFPSELSGGMRQRVVIAIALACEPRLIIADEPTTALDTIVQAQILMVLKRVVRETATSIILVSHDMGVIAAMCSRVYIMNGGEIVEEGSAEDIFYSPQKEYTKQLLRDAGGTDRKAMQIPADEKTVLTMEKISKKFDGHEGVRGVNLELKKGEIYALAGESGSGKTTMARILTGMLREDEGRLILEGRMMEKGKRLRSFGGRVQMVFQDPYASLNPGLTVGQALAEALRGNSLQDSDRRIRSILEQVGLSEKDADRYPHNFSGGQRQRIGIARALIVEPEILVCDEALSSLDATTREQILDLILTLQKKIGFTCLFISHDLHLVRRISNRISVMYGGQIVETGPTRKVCSDPWHPYTKQLISAIPEPDPLRAVKIKATPVKGHADIRSKGCPFAGRCGYVMECCSKENPGEYMFEDRTVSCFLYSQKHSGRRTQGYKMISQI